MTDARGLPIARGDRVHVEGTAVIGTITGILDSVVRVTRESGEVVYADAPRVVRLVEDPCAELAESVLWTLKEVTAGDYRLSVAHIRALTALAKMVKRNREECHEVV